MAEAYVPDQTLFAHLEFQWWDEATRAYLNPSLHRQVEPETPWALVRSVMPSHENQRDYVRRNYR